MARLQQAPTSLDGFGGGTLLHLSVETAVLCSRYGCDVFLIPPYCTKCICALDMQPHSCMSKMWSAFKQEHGRQVSSDLGIFPALKALRHIVHEGLNEENRNAGWAHIGLIPGEAVNRNKVLVDRFHECFQSKRAGGGLETTPKSKSAGVLDLVSKISPKKERCSQANCRHLFRLTYRHCPKCGAANEKFDAEEFALNGPGKKPGWIKRPLASS